MCDPANGNGEQVTTYFIMKCVNIDSLQHCIKSNDWACRIRSKPPQPHDLLQFAHQKGKVIMIFSVNGQHGWHGYCQSCFEVKSIEQELGIVKEETQTQNAVYSLPMEEMQSEIETNVASDFSNKIPGEKCDTWHHFPVKWLVHFQKINTYSCLDFKYTDHLTLSDGSLLNKARNWQEIPCDVGKELCRLIEDHHRHLTAKEHELQALNKPESFFKNDQDLSVLKEKDTWQTVITKITKDLGKVHLACPFGSQRYNCSTPDSDLDIFIVYQAKTVDVLGLEPPKQTIKNSHHEEVDYSVLELQRYCELLVKGDAKCVETLFLSDSPVVVSGSPAWKRLCTLRSLLLTRCCLDKYMKEVKGTTGLKLFQRWRDSNPDIEELTPKLTKLGYIVLRLLQNARDMVKHNDLVVFRSETSTEREELMTSRTGGYTYSKFMEVVGRYLEEIEKHEGQLEADMEKAKSKIQDWLVECRVEDLKQDSTVQFS